MRPAARPTSKQNKKSPVQCVVSVANHSSRATGNRRGHLVCEHRVEVQGLQTYFLGADTPSRRNFKQQLRANTAARLISVRSIQQPRGDSAATKNRIRRTGLLPVNPVRTMPSIARPRQREGQKGHSHRWLPDCCASIRKPFTAAKETSLTNS